MHFHITSTSTCIGESTNLRQPPFLPVQLDRNLSFLIKHPFMAPSRVLKSRRTSLVRNDKTEVAELSQPGSQSSDDNQVTKLATEMQRGVL